MVFQVQTRCCLVVTSQRFLGVLHLPFRRVSRSTVCDSGKTPRVIYYVLSCKKFLPRKINRRKDEKKTTVIKHEWG